MAGRDQVLDGHPPALQIADGADRLAREQLVATHMQAAERRQRQAGIQLMHDRTGEVDAEIQVALLDHLHLGDTQAGCQKLNVREALGTYERLDHIHRSETDGRRLPQADRGDLRRPLGGERFSSAKDAGGAGRGHDGEKIAARLYDRHRKLLCSVSGPAQPRQVA